MKRDDGDRYVVIASATIGELNQLGACFIGGQNGDDSAHLFISHQAVETIGAQHKKVS
jgi:hypothetical protein